MPSITRLVVPLDGSDEAEAAVLPALGIARALQAPIELVTVRDRARGTWARNVDDLAASLSYDQVEVAVVGTGWAGDVIIGMVTEQAGTVVCMATHNRDRFARLVAGSVTEHVLNAAPAPVLVVGPDYRPHHEEEGYERAVVCLDGSLRDETSLAVAESWARRLGLTVELAHAAETGEDAAAFDARTEQALQRLDGAGVAATYTRLSGSDAAGELTRLLGERPRTLAILSCRGRTGIARLVLGSVSSELLETSPAPLLLARLP